MVDSFKDLYDRIAHRKRESKETGPYAGGNGRIDRAVDLILNEDFPRSGSLMDVGGATGNLGYALRDYFSDRSVVEIAEDCRIPAGVKGNVFFLANVDTSGLPGLVDSYDLVVALDFIEHIIDPEKFARECFKILKPGGKVLINTPNIQFWKHLHSLVVEGRFPHTSGDKEVYHGGHVAFFNWNDMCDIFGRAGFVDHTMHTRGLTPEPPPPIWTSISKAGGIQLSYADLIYSARKAL